MTESKVEFNRKLIGKKVVVLPKRQEAKVINAFENDIFLVNIEGELKRVDIFDIRSI